MKAKGFLFALVLAIACAFGLVGCSGDDGYYIEGSLESNITYYSSLKQVSAIVYFQVDLPIEAKYDITYTLELYCKGRKVREEKFTESKMSDGESEADIHKYWTVDYSSGDARNYDFEVEVADLTAKPSTSSSSDHDGLSIGFGIVGGVLLIGSVALFIYLNKRGKAGAER